MDKILSLQKMETTTSTQIQQNSDYSATCDGNSCISYKCGGGIAK